VTDWLVLLPRAAAERIAATGSGWGHLNITVSGRHNLAAVTGVGDRDQIMLATDLGLPAGHPLTVSDAVPMSAVWHRVDPVLHAQWLDCRMRAASLTTAAFRKLVIRGWVALPADRPRFTLTHAPGEQPEWAAWWIDREQAKPADLDLPGAPGLGWDQLQPGWPVASLRDARVTVVGAGSIGSAVAYALSGYGVGRIALVDPDRLLSHNLIRHELTARHLGLMKVDGLAEELRHLWPETVVEPLALDVATDADLVRPLFDVSALIVCAADGVVPRRVVSHLARRAQVPAVLACVLEDGEIGEIIRLLPWPTNGCLLCHRQYLADKGGFDSEPVFDISYGQGTDQRPMTAVAGDLQLVGQLTAKVAIATLLERAGYYDQVLPGDHLVVALRPRPGLPTPADVHRAGELRWSGIGPPRPGCPTCQPASSGDAARSSSGAAR
jgi:molybdopterin-synthase adenylyltransferase